MNTRLFAPVAIVSMLALAACENNTDAPAQPDPDAGMPVSSEVVGENETIDTDADAMTPAEMEQRRQEIEQDAQRTFESIMEDTQQAGDQLVELGGQALDSITTQIDTTADAIATQMDAVVAQAAEYRDENLTEAQRLEIVANARNAVESTARTFGQSEAEIRQAGDTAEARARQAMGFE